MKTEVITESKALELLKQAGLKPVLPYRGYATAIADTSRIGMRPDGAIVLITGDKEQGLAYKPSFSDYGDNAPMCSECGATGQHYAICSQSE